MPLVISARDMSFDDYLAAYEGVSAEWVDDRPASGDLSCAHRSRLTRFFATVLQQRAEAFGPGEVFLAPLPVRLNATTAVQPDVYYVGAEAATRVGESHVDGAPDLVVEIVSPGNRASIRGGRWYDYEAAGVREFWLVDADRRVVEAWRLDERSRYRQVPLGDPPVLRSEVLPGIAIPVAWLWERPLPRLHRVLNEWGLT